MGKVTLTFDNGPEPDVTPAVIDCLNRHGVKATFFVLGRKVSLPERLLISKRASEEGHWIGNHTFTHGPPLGKLDRPTALREFEEGAQALSWLDQPQRLFRPHGGGILGPHLLNPAVVEGLQAGKYSCVLWNSVPGDWHGTLSVGCNVASRIAARATGALWFSTICRTGRWRISINLSAA